MKYFTATSGFGSRRLRTAGKTGERSRLQGTPQSEIDPLSEEDKRISVSFPRRVAQGEDPKLPWQKARRRRAENIV